MVLPKASYDFTWCTYFFAFSVSLSILPHSFEIRAVGIYFSEVAIWMTILKRPFFNTTIMPASAAYSRLFVYCGQGCSWHLTEIVISAITLILLLISLCYNLVILYMSENHSWQFFPLVKRDRRNMQRLFVEHKCEVVEHVLLGQATSKFKKTAFSRFFVRPSWTFRKFIFHRFFFIR